MEGVDRLARRVPARIILATGLGRRRLPDRDRDSFGVEATDEGAADRTVGTRPQITHVPVQTEGEVRYLDRGTGRVPCVAAAWTRKPSSVPQS